MSTRDRVPAATAGGHDRHAGTRARRAAHPATHLPVVVFVAVLAVATLTRLALLALGWHDVDRAPAALAATFARGLATDIAAALAAACGAFALSALTHGAHAHRGWRLAKRHAGHLLLWAIVGFVACAEWLFWGEFGTRFNFIAVDYLIYTTEVVENIRESYPLPAVLGALGVFGLALTVLGARTWPVRAGTRWRLAPRLGAFVAAVAIAWAASWAALALNDRAALASSNVYNQELARNGPVSFIAALRDNSLSYERFYATIDPARAEALAGPYPRRTPPPATPAARPRHVVLVTVESLSAEFLGAYGGTHGLTPVLDALSRDSVWFTQLYATGTRTVRGLEALSAALPPLPGQSLVRRPEGEGIVTLGSVLREQGFDSVFLYGGYGYFDNMNAYFSANGYRVRDRRDFAPAHTAFANAWGVADEYLYGEAIDELDRAEHDGRRRFLHLMTTSNHRPYTYPDGRIDIASGSGRNGAIKYTDWAIGDFLARARSRPWFDETLFVIVADHCASSAGRTQLPPDRYHIPALLYAPKYLAPRHVDALASQIDLVPTLLDWLGLDGAQRFLGQDLLSGPGPGRAYLSTYQEIGRLAEAPGGGRDLVALAPRRKVTQYRVAADDDVVPVPLDPARAERTIADFQFASRVLERGGFAAGAPSPTGGNSP